MTSLQQMALIRIGNINEEVRTLLPCKLNLDGCIEIPVRDFERLRDIIFEQQSWLDALWDEEQND